MSPFHILIVKWELETIPIIVGEDAYLKCIVKGGGSFHNCTKYWMGGENFKVLDSNGNPQSPNKYRMKISKAGDVFYLIIRRVTYADTTYNYSCTCGLSIFEGKMNITSNGIVGMYSDFYYLFLFISMLRVYDDTHFLETKYFPRISQLKAISWCQHFFSIHCKPKVCLCSSFF